MSTFLARLAAKILPQGGVVYSITAERGRAEAKKFVMDNPLFAKDLFELASRQDVRFSIGNTRNSLNFFTYLLANACSQTIFVNEVPNMQAQAFSARDALLVKLKSVPQQPFLFSIPEMVSMADNSILERLHKYGKPCALLDFIRLGNTKEFEAYAAETFASIRTPAVPELNC